MSIAIQVCRGTCPAHAARTVLAPSAPLSSLQLRRTRTPPKLRRIRVNTQSSEGEALEEDEEEEYIELPEYRHLVIQDGFQPELAGQLRAHFDERFADPLRATSERFAWDWWHVPGQYTLLRTPANSFFPPELYDKLEDALVAHGESQLGCRGISPLWLSCYVHGCRQELHADSPHGPWAFVYSLTKWEGRPFSGGETMLLRPRVLDYWRDFDPGAGAEVPQLMEHVEPWFGRLTAFDPRLPHGVRVVEGTADPRAGRLVLHGWYTTPEPFFEGSLSAEQVVPTLNALLAPLYAELAALPPLIGTVVTRITVDGTSGEPTHLEWLTNTLVARPGGGLAEEATHAALAAVAERLLGARFPPAAGPTRVTVPVVFE